MEEIIKYIVIGFSWLSIFTAFIGVFYGIKKFIQVKYTDKHNSTKKSYYLSLRIITNAIMLCTTSIGYAIMEMKWIIHSYNKIGLIDELTFSAIYIVLIAIVIHDNAHFYKLLKDEIDENY